MQVPTTNISHCYKHQQKSAGLERINGQSATDVRLKPTLKRTEALEVKAPTDRTSDRHERFYHYRLRVRLTEAELERVSDISPHGTDTPR